MANYFVASGGSNTSPYDTWAKAATSLQAALTAASSGTDFVIVQYDAVPSSDAEISADITYTFAANTTLLSASNDGGSAFTPTAMGTANWIGNSTTNRAVTFAGGYICTIYGLTLRVSGTSGDTIYLVANSDGAGYTYSSCYFWQGNTSGAAAIFAGGSGSTYTIAVKCKDSTFRFGATSQGFAKGTCVWEFENCIIDSAGSAPVVLFETSSEVFGSVIMTGCDLSHVTGTLFLNNQNGPGIATLIDCKLGSGVTVLTTQTVKHVGSLQVYLYNCSSGDTHYEFGYHNPLGSLVAYPSIYADDGPTYDGANKFSWRIDTSASATFNNPFVTPWTSTYHSGTAAITPRLEILRNGSTTAFDDDEVWGEFSYQGTTGYPISTIVTDRMAIGGTPAAQTTGMGTTGWHDTSVPGNPATAWSGKVNPASTITPAEIGELKARVCVGLASATVYVDPQIRTA